MLDSVQVVYLLLFSGGHTEMEFRGIIFSADVYSYWPAAQRIRHRQPAQSETVI
jgi:hypothetical protein